MIQKTLKVEDWSRVKFLIVQKHTVPGDYPSKNQQRREGVSGHWYQSGFEPQSSLRVYLIRNLKIFIGEFDFSKV